MDIRSFGLFHLPSTITFSALPVRIPLNVNISRTSPFSPFVKNLIVLKGGTGQKARQRIAKMLKSIPEDEERLILATGRYIGEGFDDSRLDTLFLALPISWRGTLSQYAGRLHRLHDMKKDVLIYDYVDLEVPVLAKMYKRRLSGYKAIGYKITD